MQQQHTELAVRREIEKYVHPQFQFIWVWEMVQSGNRSTTTQLKYGATNQYSTVVDLQASLRMQIHAWGTIFIAFSLMNRRMTNEAIQSTAVQPRK